MWKLAVLVALACTGCFTSWAITQSAGGQRILDEGMREERVPRPDVRERLRVSMPLAPRFPTPTTPSTTAMPHQPADPLPFALACSSSQTASDHVYRSGFRYGSRWKKIAAVMFVVEAALATTYYFAGEREKPETKLAVGFFGLDAIGTAALFFVPRKEIDRDDVVGVVSKVRSDCPAGLILEVASETFPVDAAGRIGELGEAALDAWMQAPTAAPIRLTYHDRVIDLVIGQNEVCTWNRTRHQEQSSCPAYWASAPMIAAVIEVPMGTLTRAE